MELIKTTTSTVQDLKQILQEQGIDSTNLRIDANIG